MKYLGNIQNLDKKYFTRCDYLKGVCLQNEIGSDAQADKSIRYYLHTRGGQVKKNKISRLQNDFYALSSRVILFVEEEQ